MYNTYDIYKRYVKSAHEIINPEVLIHPELWYLDLRYMWRIIMSSNKRRNKNYRVLRVLPLGMLKGWCFIVGLWLNNLCTRNVLSYTRSHRIFINNSLDMVYIWGIPCVIATIGITEIKVRLLLQEWSNNFSIKWFYFSYTFY